MCPIRKFTGQRAYNKPISPILPMDSLWLRKWWYKASAHGVSAIDVIGRGCAQRAALDPLAFSFLGKRERAPI